MLRQTFRFLCYAALGLAAVGCGPSADLADSRSRAQTPTTGSRPVTGETETTAPDRPKEVGQTETRPNDAKTEPKADDNDHALEPKPNPADETADQPESAEPSEGNSAATTGTAETGTAETGTAETGDAKAGDLAAGQDAKENLKTERIALFTLQGPLIVEVVLSIDGEPHDQALARLVQYVLKAADTNKDGRPTWDELTNSPKFTYGQLGNAPLTTAENKRNAIQLYDVTKNGRVDASEVPRFLTRNAGGSRTFDFRSANYYRDINRSDSPLFELLDFNDDGRIDFGEADQAEAKLQARDADSDGVLFLNEVANSSEERPGPLTQRRVSAGAAASWLGGRAKWTNILYAMEEQYMLGGSLRRSAFELTPDLFDRLDKNDDDRVDSKEVAAMATVEPHIRIEAHFGDRGETESPRLNLTSLHADLQDTSSVEIGNDRITIQFPKDRLLIFLKDQAGSRQTGQQATALLNQYDADKNGYLDESEFPEQTPVLLGGIEAYDSDEDGKVYKAEIEGYLANAGVAQRSQIRSRAGDQTDALFDALDSDQDGRLDGREIHAIPERLKQMDRDQDGELIVDEIPGSMALALVRGSPQQTDTLFAIPVSKPTPPENAPRWFLSMDRNQDGAIARSEFLGEPQQFAELDADDDGFVSADEIETPAEQSEE